MLGTIGGAAGWLATSGLEWVAGALVLASGALVAVAYLVSAPRAGVDGTTEVAAIAVVALGMLSGIGEVGVAAAATAVVAMALSEKDTIHGLLARVDAHELRAALRFAVLALVVLPVLPDRSFGPWGGINPRSLWSVVLIFSGLNFAGYAARGIVGASRGYGVTGALGGLISSTAVTLNFSRYSRVAPALSGALGIGVVAASTVLLPRILVVSTILNPPMAVALVPLLAPALVAGVALVIYWLWRHPEARQDGQHGQDPLEHSPLGLWSSIKMAAAFQLALTIIEVVRGTLGSPGVLASAALFGLTDTDALTLAMSRLATDAGAVRLAATAIAVGVLANALMKLTLSLALGAPAFRRVAGWGLALLAMASAAALAVSRM